MDRIVAQVVDPKVNHIFRPQVERVVREFLSPGSCSEEPPAPPPSVESKPDSSALEQGTSHFCIWKCLQLEGVIQNFYLRVNMQMKMVEREKASSANIS